MKKQVLEGVRQRELSHIVLSVNRGNLYGLSNTGFSPD